MQARRALLVGLLLLGACGGPAPSASTPGTPAGPSEAPTPAVTPAASIAPLVNTPFATPTPPPVDLSSVPARVHVEAEAASVAWIGPAGGSLSATAADGTTYSLAIPEDALSEPTPIAMTPVSGVDDLGLSGGLAGAVYLQPSGLALAVPAILEIETGRTAPDGTRLVGFDVADEGTATELVPTAGEGDEISVLVHHFSAPGAAYGTTTDLATISQAALPTRLAGLLTILLADPVPWSSETKIANGLLIDFQWAGSPIQTQGPALGLRQVIDATTTDAELLRAVKDWRMFIFALNLYLHDGDAAAAIAEGDGYAAGVRASHTVAYEDGKIVLGRRFRRAIDGNETLCTASHDLRALANMWFWAGLGGRYAPAEADWPSEAGGCADLIVDVANLPTNLATNGADSLSLTFALEFTDRTKVPADVEASLAAGNFGFVAGGSQLVAPVAAGTTMTAAVTASQGPPYNLTVSACWFLDGLRRDLCGGPYPYPFGSAQATPTPSPSGSVGPGASGLPDLTGEYQIFSHCNWAGEPGQLGHGSGRITQSGASVSMDWTMVWDSPDGLKTCGSSIVDRLESVGHFDGQIEVQPSGAIYIVVASICDSPRDSKMSYSRLGFFIPSCPYASSSGVLVKAQWIGP